MGLFFNGNVLAETSSCYFQNNAVRRIFYNELLGWEHAMELFNGGFKGLGTPTSGYMEGQTFATNQIISNQWLINCDGRSDFWFPNSVTGYSTLHITVNAREGDGHCYFFAAPDKNRWGHTSPHFAECTTPGTYTLGISTGTVFIGTEALMGGIWIARMWLT